MQDNSENSIYSQLAKLPKETADKITNAKTGGGRNLNAVYKSKNLKFNEKALLSWFGGELNFNQDFENQYRYAALSVICEELSISKDTAIRILKSLEEKGYVRKRASSKSECRNGQANHYCMTSKIFDEYLQHLIDKANLTGSKIRPVQVAKSDPYGSQNQTEAPPVSSSNLTPSMCVEKKPHTPKGYKTSSSNPIENEIRVVEAIKSKLIHRIADHGRLGYIDKKITFLSNKFASGLNLTIKQVEDIENYMDKMNGYLDANSVKTKDGFQGMIKWILEEIEKEKNE